MGKKQTFIYETCENPSDKVVNNIHETQHNTNLITAFRWPLFATALTEKDVIVRPLFEKQQDLWYRISINLGEETNIVSLEFSKKGNLYIAVESEKSFMFYKVKVMDELKKKSAKRITSKKVKKTN